jgi:arylsulfatase A-like enzyme
VADATRRAFVAGAIGALAGAEALAAGPRRRPPNFLFFLADDMGFADLSCYGRREYRTPALDALAAQGMRFTSAYANSSVCTPSRVALMTGRYQQRLAIGLEEPLAQRNVGLPPDQPTLASVLRGRGYATSLIGKWHLGKLPAFDPLQSGYEEFWGVRGGAVDYFTHEFSGEPDLWDGSTRIDRAGYLTDLLADRTVETLQRFRKSGRPWLISLHFTAPHWPWEGPSDQTESARLAAQSSRGALLHFDGGDMATYAAIVTRMDEQVGRVLRELRRLGMRNDTVVVFTSDNGGERFSDTWPFTGRKTELLEGGLRVPAIVRWPGLSSAGSISDAQIMTMDWLPTFAAAAGGADDASLQSDGIDIRSAIAGQALPERTLYWRYGNMEQAAARRGNWKYLKIKGNTYLFDVVADPMERANQKLRNPSTFEQLQAAWSAWNATMLPIDPRANTTGFSGAQLADHFGEDD